ncbi:Biopolymer transport protein ExbD [Microbulbifer aggregans]|uniref:Biopolymer transport protein ExbD n=1 Tax=Microbulbifer aggregans TaxID=1769779 RepID=A0A1C9W9N5_9GAMM|nr:biopolymer transporter ExbD [Microbulbifer aggregans]AOS97859.1 Biopolymer transport protein ExbD [Microbulbifer aggregans]
MQFRRQKREQDGVNLTPLIDVVFLLLIFFMVSTTFTKESHLKLNLPEAAGPQAEAQPRTVEVLINADGSYAVDGRALINKKLATLKSALSEVSAGEYNRPLVITADATAQHQAVVRAMDAAGQLGFVHLSITTRQPEEN